MAYVLNKRVGSCVCDDTEVGGSGWWRSKLGWQRWWGKDWDSWVGDVVESGSNMEGSLVAWEGLA